MFSRTSRLVGCSSLFASLFLASAAAVEMGAGSAAKTGLKGGPRVPQPMLRPPSEEARQAMQRFQLPPNFKTELWAAEPLLGNPVAFDIDNLGRCFVAETYRYRTSVLDIRHYLFMLEDDMANRTVADREAQIRRNFPDEWQQLGIETELVRLVEDRDKNGVADFSAVFADGFTTTMDGIASGVLAHDGHVWFTNIPNLWRLEGPGAEGRATKREVLSTGYGVRFSFTGHDMHGLALGPDGRLYFSIGDRGAHVQTREGKTIAVPDEGAVFRCEQDGSHLELFARGLRNPQELAFDNFGNLFTGDNDCDQGDQERWEFLVEGGDYGWRVGWQHPPLGKAHNPWLTEKLWVPHFPGQAAYILPPIANIPDGPSGVAHYPGTGLTSAYNDHFLVCSFKGTSARSAIYSWSLQPKGASFSLVNQQVFVGDCQATDVAFGPDSKVYFTEWGEGWEGTGRGRIFCTFNQTTIADPRVAEVQRLLGGELKKKSPAELRDLLGHADQRVRLEAEWALAKVPEGEKLLRETALSSATTVARLHAIWGLGIVARQADYKTLGAGAKVVESLLPLLTDRDLEVRAQAAQVLGERRVDAAYDGLVKMLRGEELRPRLFAALALGKLGRREVAGQLPLVIPATGENDPVLRHAYVMALLGLNDFGAVVEMAKHTDPHVRMVALLAMRRLGRAEIAQFLRDENPLLVMEAARAINDEGITAATPMLAALLAKPPAISDSLLFHVLNANFRAGTTANATALAAFAANPHAAEPLRLEALKLLALWVQPPPRDRVAGVFRPLPARDAAPASAALRPVLAALLGQGSPDVRLATIEAVAALAIKDSTPALLRLLGDQQVSAKVRGRALEVIAAFEDPALAEAVRLALADNDPGLRVTAAAMLSRLDPEASARQLADAFPAAAIAEKKAVLLALGGIPGATSGGAVARLLGEMSKGKIPPEVQLELLEAAARHQAPEVQAALQAYQTSLPKDDPLAAFRPALVGGDRERGETLFREHAAAACLRCHKINGSGGEAGPELSDIAAKKDRAYLLASIILPNAQIAAGFQMMVVTMKNGEIQAGLLQRENDQELVLQIPGAPPVTLKKAEIKSRENAPSGMPPNIGDLLTKREIRDLVEFVASLKGG